MIYIFSTSKNQIFIKIICLIPNHYCQKKRKNILIDYVSTELNSTLKKSKQMAQTSLEL